MAASGFEVQNDQKIYQLLNAGNESGTLICFHHGMLFRFIFAAWAARSKLICSERNALEMCNISSSK